MKSLSRLLVLRYSIAVAVIIVGVAVILAASSASISEWLILVGSLLFALVVLSAITVWTGRHLSGDLEEVAEALEKMVLEKELDRMPQPHLKELAALATDLDTVAEHVTDNYQLLQKEKDRLEVLLSAVNAGIIAVGADGRVELMNPAAERILGASKENALGRTFAEIHHARGINNAVERARKGTEINEEVVITLPRRRTLRIQASPITDAEGGHAGLVCVLEDLTAQRRLERIRRDFVLNVSHELRTPAANLRAVVDALLSGAADDPDAAGRFLADLDGESSRLAFIIEDLLVLSRLESDETLFMEAPFDVRELVTEVVEEKSDLAGRHEVELSSECGEGVTLVGDRGLVRNACCNLVDNAVKYNHPGGEVRVSARASGETVLISVADTGVGIAPREQEKVFERFYRVDRDRSRATGGTGLGLSIVKHAVELHGGEVTVESTLGKGSTFTISMPEAPTL